MASIKNVDFERSLKDVRNDILTVGQRRGMWVPSGKSEIGIDSPEFDAGSNSQIHIPDLKEKCFLSPDHCSGTGNCADQPFLYPYLDQPGDQLR